MIKHFGPHGGHLQRMALFAVNTGLRDSPNRGRPIRTMNNTAWQRARKEVSLPRVRVHDLRHTFATRLRAAGVLAEDRAALLGHAVQSMTGHYASADIGRLIGLENRVLDRIDTCTILRVANG